MQSHAKSVKEAAEHWLQDGKNGFKDDPHMLKAYREDYNQLVKLANLIESGKYKPAAKYAQSLDTILRDEIPHDVWDFLWEQ